MYVPTRKLITHNKVLKEILCIIEVLIKDIIAMDYKDLVFKYMYYKKVEPKLYITVYLIIGLLFYNKCYGGQTSIALSFFIMHSVLLLLKCSLSECL